MSKNIETHYVQLMIDNNEMLSGGVLDSIKRGEIKDADQLETYVEDMFPEAFGFVRGDEERYEQDPLNFVPGLLATALSRVDYKYLLEHFQMRISEGA